MINFIKNSQISKIFNILKRKKLKIGDKIKLSGGYEIPPEWLSGKDAYYGKVINFILGPYKKEDAVIQLEEEISVGRIKGKILVLTLRYKGAIWGKTEIVHLHLFNTFPQEDQWRSINKNEWDKNHVESHAIYRIV